MRGIGVQISTHDIVVEGQLISDYLLLHVYNHYTQQSTMALFIPCSGLTAEIIHRTFLGMEDEMIFFFDDKAIFIPGYACVCTL